VFSDIELCDILLHHRQTSRDGDIIAHLELPAAPPLVDLVCSDERRMVTCHLDMTTMWCNAKVSLLIADLDEGIRQ
jgi:hypothetical protein